MTWGSALAHRLRLVTPERRFLAVFALLLAAFLIGLAVTPGAVGRGGR